MCVDKSGWKVALGGCAYRHENGFTQVQREIHVSDHY